MKSESTENLLTRLGCRVVRGGTTAVGVGWHKLIEDLVKDLFIMGWNGEVYQAKEKFGSLRFYVNGINEELCGRIDKAEHQSIKTCEVCGKKGKLRDLAWTLTLCDTDYKKKIKELNR